MDPGALGDRCAEIGFAWEMVVKARRPNAHRLGQVSEVETAVALRLCGKSGGLQDGFL